MDEMERTVAAETDELINGLPEAAEAPADDARAAEVTAEELIESLTEQDGGETAESTGDGGQAADGEGRADEKRDDKQDEDRTGRRIAAALKQQRKTIFAELGMSEAQVRELVLAHRAEAMAKADPEISPKAAKRILEAEAGRSGADVEAIKDGVRTLMEDGWTREELTALTRDAQVIADMNGGMSVRQAARAYTRRQAASADAGPAASARGPRGRGKSAVPTVRTGSAQGTDGARDPIAAMTDKEFAEFSDKAYEAMLAGKTIRI